MLAPALDVLREFLAALLDVALGLPRQLAALFRRPARLRLFDQLERDVLPEAATAPAPSATLRRVVISCGDASGEAHALRLMRVLRERHPEIRFEGFGGTQLAAEGMEVWQPLADLNVMGFKDVAAQLPLFFRCVYRFARHLAENPPDAVILVDYPGLNRHLLKISARRRVPVIDFIAPQLWAWSSWRIRDFRKADALLTILPFERDWYRRHGAEAHYIGHPLADALQAPPEGEVDPPAVFGEDACWVGILPGSRHREIRENLPILLQAATELLRRRPEVRFVLPHLRDQVQPLLTQMLAESDTPVVYAHGSFHTVLPRLSAAWVVSGTASLEVAARDVPSVVVYAMPSRIGRWLARAAVAVPHVAAINLIAGREVVVERLGGDVAPKTLADDLDALLEPSRHAAAVRELAALRQDHLRPCTADRAVVAIEDAVNRSRSRPLT